jgi:ABC-2 type transport system permease protein
MRLLSLYKQLVVAQIRAQMQYRASFWMDMVSTGLLSGISFLSLALILQRFGSIAGWTLGEVAFLAGVAETSFGIMDLIFSGFDPDFFSPNIQAGNLDQLMLRPVPLPVQILGSRFVIRRLGRIVEGSAILATALILTPIQWSLGKIIYLPVVMISKVLIMGALFIIGSTITFWTIQRIQAMNILTYGGTELMSYPMNIFPGWIQRFFTYIVPFIFVNYLPGLYFLGKPDPLGWPVFTRFLAPLVAVVTFFVAIRFWRFGLRHYQSTGT